MTRLVALAKNRCQGAPDALAHHGEAVVCEGLIVHLAPLAKKPSPSIVPTATFYSLPRHVAGCLLASRRRRCLFLPPKICVIRKLLQCLVTAHRVEKYY